MRKFKLWSPSPEGKLACHLCRLSSHSHHPWKIERRKAARDEGREERKSWEHQTRGRVDANFRGERDEPSK